MLTLLAQSCDAPSRGVNVPAAILAVLAMVLIAWGLAWLCLRDNELRWAFGMRLLPPRARYPSPEELARLNASPYCTLCGHRMSLVFSDMGYDGATGNHRGWGWDVSCVRCVERVCR